MSDTFNMKAASVPIDHDCVIFDIDGTLTNNAHRAHHLQKSPKDWNAYNAAMHMDEPVDVLVNLAKILRQHYAIVLCSGRMEQFREVTVAWMRKADVWYDGLFMRRTNDFRQDAIVKRELLYEIRATGFRPKFVIDDRKQVVDMWRAEGLICLQAAEGDF